MDLFNRIVMTIVLVVMVLFALTIAFTALFIPAEAVVTLRNFAGSLLTSINLFSQILVAVIAGILAVVCFLLLLVELSPQRMDGVQLAQVKSGSAVLSKESVIQRVRQTVELIPQVTRAEPIVSSRGKSVDIKLDLFLDPAADVPTKTEEVAVAVRDAVESKLGVKINKVEINVKHQTVQPVGTGSRGAGVGSSV